MKKSKSQNSEKDQTSGKKIVKIPYIFAISRFFLLFQVLDTYPSDFITVHSATSLEFSLGVRQISLLMLLDFIQHCSESSLEGKGVTTEQ